MAVHQCERFFNHACHLHIHVVKRITKYLARTSTNMDSPYGNRRWTTRGVFYKPNKGEIIEYNIDVNFAGGWSQADADNA